MSGHTGSILDRKLRSTGHGIAFTNNTTLMTVTAPPVVVVLLFYYSYYWALARLFAAAVCN